MLTLSQPPPSARQIINRALGSIMDQGTATTEMALGGASPLDIAAPHKTYFLALQDLVAGRVLPAAVMTGWRYIVLRNELPLASAELAVSEAGGGEGAEGSLEFSQFNRGPFVASTVEGVGMAEELDAVRTDDYELRMIEIPSLYVVTLWLHNEAGQEDILIPLRPTRPEIRAYQPYTEEELAAALHEAAVRKLEYVQGEGGGSTLPPTEEPSGALIVEFNPPDDEDERPSLPA